MVPIFRVKDAAKAIAFYQRVGFVLEGTHQFACRPACLRVPAARQRAASPVRAHGRCTKKIAGLLLGSGPRRNRRSSLARPSSKHHGPANWKSWTPTATGSAAANPTQAPASARPPCVSFRTHSAPKTDALVTQTPRHLGSDPSSPGVRVGSWGDGCS